MQEFVDENLYCECIEACAEACECHAVSVRCGSSCGCDCGNIRWHLESTLAPTVLSANPAPPNLTLEASHSGLPLHPPLKVMIPPSQNKQSSGCDLSGPRTSTITKLPTSHNAKPSSSSGSIPRLPTHRGSVSSV